MMRKLARSVNEYEKLPGTDRHAWLKLGESDSEKGQGQMSNYSHWTQTWGKWWWWQDRNIEESLGPQAYPKLKVNVICHDLNCIDQAETWGLIIGLMVKESIFRQTDTQTPHFIYKDCFQSDHPPKRWSDHMFTQLMHRLKNIKIIILLKGYFMIQNVLLPYLFPRIFLWHHSIFMKETCIQNFTQIRHSVSKFGLRTKTCISLVHLILCHNFVLLTEWN